MLVCDKCSAGINDGAKFCPQCGDPVTEADRVTIPVTDGQVAHVEISFGHSSSQNFNKAVEICQNIPSYSASGEGKQAQYKISLPITEVELLIKIFDFVGSWKSSQMLINGHSATKKDLTYYGVGCYRNCQKAYRPAQYCFGERVYDANIWGCKRLGMPVYEWGGGWLDYGKFDNSGVWYFDKNRIKHELELALKENELCPALDRKSVMETLEKLPESINPKTDSNWEYRTNFEKVFGKYKEVAVGVKPVIKKINKYILGDFNPEWESEHQPKTEYNSHIIKVNLDTKEISQREESSDGSYSKFWWIAVILIVILILIAV
ncbi:zinc ribbon domain-containing protein [Photobacterium piscicola]|uniref:zinc ribbon domain-containing protein n=1 Tax=Photobacterium piscicola TaxID=1378299 RepID=UPI002E19E701|nr:zinc ribbon domain-containing protein [Photobacterium piscicola]